MLKKEEALPLPEPFDYVAVPQLCTEEVEILNARQPPTLGVASRTRGICLLLLYCLVKRMRMSAGALLPR